MMNFISVFCSTNDEFYTILNVMDFTLKMMNFTLRMTDCKLKMTDFIGERLKDLR